MDPSQGVSASAGCCLQWASPGLSGSVPRGLGPPVPVPRPCPSRPHLAGTTQHSRKRRASLGETATQPSRTRLEGALCSPDRGPPCLPSAPSQLPSQHSSWAWRAGAARCPHGQASIRVSVARALCPAADLCGDPGSPERSPPSLTLPCPRGKPAGGDHSLETARLTSFMVLLLRLITGGPRRIHLEACFGIKAWGPCSSAVSVGSCFGQRGGERAVKMGTEGTHRTADMGSGATVLGATSRREKRGAPGKLAWRGGRRKGRTEDGGTRRRRLWAVGPVLGRSGSRAHRGSGWIRSNFLSGTKWTRDFRSQTLRIRWYQTGPPAGGNRHPGRMRETPAFRRERQTVPDWGPQGGNLQTLSPRGNPWRGSGGLAAPEGIGHVDRGPDKDRTRGRGSSGDVRGRTSGKG